MGYEYVDELPKTRIFGVDLSILGTGSNGTNATDVIRRRLLASHEGFEAATDANSPFGVVASGTLGRRLTSVGWPQLAKVTANDRALNDDFGVSVALADGVLAVGAYADDDRGSKRPASAAAMALGSVG